MNLRFILLGILLGLSPAGALAAPRVVVLDPGHGGTNLGARGEAVDLYEKQLTQVYANLTATHLRRMLPSVKVVLTRTRDRYLTLTQRVRMANALKAAVFVSIHLNACETHIQKGFGTFVLSRGASDKEAARVAMKENESRKARARARKPSPGGGKGPKVDSILSNLRQVGTHADSVRLASRVQKALTRARGKALNRGIRQASFDVLMGLRMTGVLVEVGFIDHDIEGPELNTPGVQQAISRALAEAIVQHLSPAPRRTRVRPSAVKRTRRRAAKKARRRAAKKK